MIILIIFFLLLGIVGYSIVRFNYIQRPTVRCNARKRVIQNGLGKYSPEIKLGMFGGWVPIYNKSVIGDHNPSLYDRWLETKNDALKVIKAFNEFHRDRIKEQSAWQVDEVCLDVDEFNDDRIEQIMAECRDVLEQRNNKKDEKGYSKGKTKKQENKS